MNAAGLSILVFLILVVLLGPRRWALLGMAAGVLYLTQGVSVTVLGINVFAVRFLEVAGFARVMIRREFPFGRLNEIDRVFLVLYVYTTLIFLLRSDEGFAYQIGIAVDAILCYFTFRGLIGKVNDFCWFLKTFVYLLIPYVAIVAFESFTTRNLFIYMGGHTGIWFRDTSVRCFGSFRHPSLMGALGASFFPLYVGLFFSKIDRIHALIGIGASLAIVVFSNSGGPLGFSFFGAVGWGFWFFRKQLRTVRVVTFFALVFMAILMKSPLWYIVAKTSAITGGEGWHRAYLMDITFQNLDKWWLAGMPIRDTAGWFPYSINVTGGADITNQFVNVGITAGIMATVLLIWLIVISFRKIGRTLHSVRSILGDASPLEYLLWSLGVLLFGHAANWIGITYFDQFYVMFFMQFAAISNLSDDALDICRNEIVEDDEAEYALAGDMPDRNYLPPETFLKAANLIDHVDGH